MLNSRYIYFMIIMSCILFNSNILYSHDATNTCADVLYAPGLFDTDVSRSNSTTQDAMHQAMCSIDSGTISKYFKRQNYEARIWCNKSEKVIYDHVKAGGKFDFFKIIGADGDIDVENYNKWRNENCGQLERKGLLTKGQYDQWYTENCNDYGKEQYKQQFSYNAHRASFAQTKIEAWSDCMTGMTKREDPTIPVFRCWLSPYDPDNLEVVFNVYYWDPRKNREPAPLSECGWELTGGSVVQGSNDLPFLDNQNCQQGQLETLPFGYYDRRIVRETDKNLNIRISIADYAGTGTARSCRVFLPKVKKAKPTDKKPKKKASKECTISKDYTIKIAEEIEKFYTNQIKRTEYSESLYGRPSGKITFRVSPHNSYEYIVAMNGIEFSSGSTGRFGIQNPEDYEIGYLKIILTDRNQETSTRYKKIFETVGRLESRSKREQQKYLWNIPCEMFDDARSIKIGVSIYAQSRSKGELQFYTSSRLRPSP